jgi:hypothetical protein
MGLICWGQLRDERSVPLARTSMPGISPVHPNPNSAIDAPNCWENWWGTRMGIERISSRTRYRAARMSALSILYAEPKAADLGRQNFNF